MPTLDNPAGRLHNILTALFEQGPKSRLRDALVLALEIDAETMLPKLLPRVAELALLPEKVRSEVGALGLDNNVLLKRLPEVEDAMKRLSNVDIAVVNFLEPITEATMDNLEVCSSLLHLQRPQKLPTEEQLERLGLSLEDLHSQIITADLHPDLREFLKQHIFAMKEALRDFPLRGTGGLEEATDRLVGNLLRRPDLLERVQKESVGKRFLKVLTDVLVVLSVATASLELGDRVLELPSGDDSCDVTVIEVHVEQPEQRPPPPDAAP